MVLARSLGWGSYDFGAGGEDIRLIASGHHENSLVRDEGYGRAGAAALIQIKSAAP